MVGYFVRASGEAIKPDRPAHAGDVITVLGTGFGPYTTQPPDGFLLDEAAGYTLVDDHGIRHANAIPYFELVILL